MYYTLVCFHPHCDPNEGIQSILFQIAKKYCLWSVECCFQTYQKLERLMIEIRL